LFKHNFDLLS